MVNANGSKGVHGEAGVRHQALNPVVKTVGPV
jgi:hypothetical protein